MAVRLRLADGRGTGGGADRRPGGAAHRCDLRQGEQVRRGARFGIIRFGSRVDVYLPPGAEVVVKPGQTVRAGETVLAVVARKDDARAR